MKQQTIDTKYLQAITLSSYESSLRKYTYKACDDFNVNKTTNPNSCVRLPSILHITTYVLCNFSCYVKIMS